MPAPSASAARGTSRKPRRQQREFAEAAGRLLDEAGAASLAAETLYRYYRDRLCRAVHLEPEADDARLGRAVRERSGQEIAAVFEQAQNATVESGQTPRTARHCPKTSPCYGDTRPWNLKQSLGLPRPFVRSFPR